MSICAIDFGTSNSAIAVPGGAQGMRLVELEPGFHSMPTAVFYHADEEAHALRRAPRVEHGRAAIAAYVRGEDGRLMRSMKSILGSTLADDSTEVGGGRSVRYADVIVSYLRHLKRRAEEQLQAPLARAVLGRPVFFVDDDAQRDARAQATLQACAQTAGFDEVAFQYEPLAAAFDYERSVPAERLVLVVDAGGGTTDFSLVRIGPSRAGRPDRRDDILANHGVHVAGTDFDRHVELASILRTLGYRALGPPPADGSAPREVPSRVYFDLATWHLINTVYSPPRVAELRAMRHFYAQAAHHARLMRVVTQRLGHALAARAEQAKIAVASGGATRIALDDVEPGLAVDFDAARLAHAVAADLEAIGAAARETLRLAQLPPGRVEALYFTGGSTGLRLLRERLGALFAQAEPVQGDAFASVIRGLGVFAQRLHRAGNAA